jgi:IclR family transcriptional regulator, pca regulon regulatory protein
MPNPKSLSRPVRQDLDEEPPGGRDFVRALAKGLAVIEAFDAQAPAMTLSEVAKRVNLSRGTARRLLLTLVDLGYSAFDGKRFSLNPRVLRLGFAYLSSRNLWQLAQPLMAALVEKVHESCSIAVLDGWEIVYVARVPTAARIMSINLGLGTRLPAFATSMGRVLLAGLPAEQLGAALKSAPVLTAYTAKTIHDKVALLREVEVVRKQGWALVDQELEIGLRSIAAGITDANGRVIAALNIGTHASRWPMQKLMQEVLPALKETAAAISALAARGHSS